MSSSLQQVFEDVIFYSPILGVATAFLAAFAPLPRTVRVPFWIVGAVGAVSLVIFAVHAAIRIAHGDTELWNRLLSSFNS